MTDGKKVLGPPEVLGMLSGMDVEVHSISIPVETNDGYWDCECEKNYIHLKRTSPAIMIGCGACPICEAVETEQPDSRDNEIGIPEQMASERSENPCC